MTWSLGELAVRFGCTLQGDPDARVSHVATIEAADAASITFLANPRFRRFLKQTRAGAVVLEAKFAAEAPGNALLTANPYATYARIASVLHPFQAHAPGVHRTASVDPSAVVDPTAWIGANAVIGERTRIGPRVVIGPGCAVLDDVTVGADTRLAASVTLLSGVVVGERCILQPGVVVGGDGFGFAPDRGTWVKVPQIGSVRIGNDVEIGANTSIDRGAIEDTVIGDGVKMDNLIQIAHGVRVGAHTAMAGQSGIAGSTTVGQRCMIGGQVGIAGGITICDDVFVTGKSFVSSSVHKPGYYSGSLTVDESARFRKNAARFHQLDELARDVRKLRGPAEEDDAAESSGDEP